MRVASVLILPLLAATASPQSSTRQVWEKPLAAGVTFRMEIDPAGPFVTYAIRMAPGAPGVRAAAALPGKTIYDASPSSGRGTTTKIAIDNEAPAAINADFFPFAQNYMTGDPLGFMMRDGELVSTPYRGRHVFAWGPKDSFIGTVTFSGKLKTDTGEIGINAINQDCGINEVTLNTGTAGLAMMKAPASVVSLIVDDAKISPEGTIAVTVGERLAENPKLPMPANRWLLVGQGDKANSIAALKPGDRMFFEWKTTGFDWTKATNAVGGGPRLLKDGKSAVTASEEGFGAAFASTRHPRSMVGKTADGAIWWVVTDGRQKQSAGVSLAEGAALMQRLGCVDAINLDGGGSSALSLFGAAVNKPSGGVERAVANGVALYFPIATDAPAAVELKRTGDQFRLFGDGKEVENRRVIWYATGPGIIDQSGKLSRFGEGAINVRAWCAGKVATATVEK